MKPFESTKNLMVILFNKWGTRVGLSLTLTFVFLISGFSQNKDFEKPQTLLIKTNLLNLLAKGPSLSIEKFLNQTYSLEFTYMKGEFNNLLLTDHYDYSGFLIRGKRYFDVLKKGDFSSYAAVYTGLLRRNLYTVGRNDNTGFLSYPGRDFSANSIRTGASLGESWLLKNNVVIDVQCSLGYGRYLNTDPSEGTWYLDTQIWFSVGYCF